jgi:hypothetical protein
MTPALALGVRNPLRYGFRKKDHDLKLLFDKGSETCPILTQTSLEHLQEKSKLEKKVQECPKRSAGLHTVKSAEDKKQLSLCGHYRLD